MLTTKKPYYIPSKPKQCDQIWEDMKPSEKGRICAKCEKHIYDFEKMKWNEILKVHQNSMTTVCGNYNQKQIKYWGREIPKWYEPITKYLVSIGIIKIFFSNEPSLANVKSDTTFQIQKINQEQIPKDSNNFETSLVIRGKVLNSETLEPFYDTHISIVGQKGYIFTNDNGKFELKINKLSANILEKLNSKFITLRLFHLGYYIDVEISKNDMVLKENSYIFDVTLVYDRSLEKEKYSEDSAFFAHRRLPPKSFFSKIIDRISYFFSKKPFNLK